MIASPEDRVDRRSGSIHLDLKSRGSGLDRNGIEPFGSEVPRIAIKRDLDRPDLIASPEDHC